MEVFACNLLMTHCIFVPVCQMAFRHENPEGLLAAAVTCFRRAGATDLETNTVAELEAFRALELSKVMKEIFCVAVKSETHTPLLFYRNEAWLYTMHTFLPGRCEHIFSIVS